MVIQYVQYVQALGHSSGTATKSYDRTIVKKVADARKFLSKKNKEQVSACVMAKRRERTEEYTLTARENATKYLEATKSKGRGKVSLTLIPFLFLNFCRSRDVS